MGRPLESAGRPLEWKGRPYGGPKARERPEWPKWAGIGLGRLDGEDILSVWHNVGARDATLNARIKNSSRLESDLGFIIPGSVKLKRLSVRDKGR